MVAGKFDNTTKNSVRFLFSAQLRESNPGEFWGYYRVGSSGYRLLIPIDGAEEAFKGTKGKIYFTDDWHIEDSRYDCIGSLVKEFLESKDPEYFRPKFVKQPWNLASRDYADPDFHSNTIRGTRIITIDTHFLRNPSLIEGEEALGLMNLTLSAVYPARFSSNGLPR